MYSVPECISLAAAVSEKILDWKALGLCESLRIGTNQQRVARVVHQRASQQRCVPDAANRGYSRSASRWTMQAASIELHLTSHVRKAAQTSGMIPCIIFLGLTNVQSGIERIPSVQKHLEGRIDADRAGYLTKKSRQSRDGGPLRLRVAVLHMGHILRLCVTAKSQSSQRGGRGCSCQEMPAGQTQKTSSEPCLAESNTDGGPAPPAR